MMEIRKSIKQEENKLNNFIMVYDWLTILPPSEAIMLAYLIDAEDICFTRDDDDQDYFECTMSFIKSRCIGWTNSNITTSLNNLETKELIFIKNRRTNTGNFRFIKINRDKIRSLKEEYFSFKKEN